MASVVISGDTSGAITLQSPAVAGTNTVNFGANSGTAILDANTPAFRNRIINGAMVIDQRNAGASVTVNGVAANYSVDRWYGQGEATDGVFTLQQSTDAPAGFIRSLKATVTTADASIGSSQVYRFIQRIEGNNLADLNLGLSSASAFTISFWVKSSVTGTFGGSLWGASATEWYVFSYTINSANTWEYKTVNVPARTSGSFDVGTGTGLQLQFSLGAGSSRLTTAGSWINGATEYYGVTGQTNLIGTLNATWYVTGVQLEKGSTATSFDYRPYGTELALCQRYYYKETANAGSPLGQNAFAISATSARIMGKFAVTLRTRPTALEQTGTAANYFVYTGGTTRVCSAVPLFNDATTETWFVSATVASGQTAGHGGSAGSDAANVYLAWSAEL
jgi:hypothetical protein